MKRRRSALSNLVYDSPFTNREVAEALDYAEDSWRVIRNGSCPLPKEKQAMLAHKLGIPLRRVQHAARVSYRPKAVTP